MAITRKKYEKAFQRNFTAPEKEVVFRVLALNLNKPDRFQSVFHNDSFRLALGKMAAKTPALFAFLRAPAFARALLMLCDSTLVRRDGQADQILFSREHMLTTLHYLIPHVLKAKRDYGMEPKQQIAWLGTILEAARLAEEEALKFVMYIAT